MTVYFFPLYYSCNSLLNSRLRKREGGRWRENEDTREKERDRRRESENLREKAQIKVSEWIFLLDFLCAKELNFMKIKIRP